MKKIVLILLGIICALGAIFFFKINEFYRTVNTGNGVFAKPTTVPDKSTYNILLLGYGGAGHDGAYLTDTIMIVHMDLKTNKVVLISLPRDLWVEVPGKNGPLHAKINSVYEMALFPNDYPAVKVKGNDKQAAAELVKEVVGNITGLPIDNYVAVDFGGFKEIISLLGGVDVKVEKTFDDYEYPIDGKENDSCGKDEQIKQVEPYMDKDASDEARMDFFKDKKDLEEFMKNINDDPALAFPCRYEHIHFDKGLQHMDGPTALKYARSRHSLQDGTDFGRAKRQQLVMEAVKEKVLSFSFVTKIIPLMEQGEKIVRMDLDIDQIKKIVLEGQKDGSKYRITNLVPSLDNFLKNGSSSEGQYILAPQNGVDEWDDMKKWINDTIEGITPTPTPGPTKVPVSKTPTSAAHN